VTAGTLVNFITYRDHKLMQRVNGWYPPRWVRLFALWATRAGDGWLWWALGIAILLFGGPERFLAVGCTGLTVGLGILLFRMIKKTTGRRRPHVFKPNCWVTLLPPDQFSFPSGHTITAFAVAVSMSLFYHDLTIPLLMCALSIAVSRILLGMHFLSDVLAGVAIGTGLALLTTSFVL
jgi:undecaprenyl-diphosphatase